MELHPAYKFNFTPQPNGGLIVRSRHYTSEEMCSRNTGLQWADAGGVAFLPATYLKACQHEADKFDGFFVLHGLERWTDGPVLLYSIYPMHSAEYFHLSRGRFGVMQWPRGTESFALPATSWPYMATPDHTPHLPRLQPSVRTLLSSPDQPERGQDETIHLAQAMAPSNRRRFLRNRDSHSSPPPIAADGTPRMSYVEAGLGSIESNKQVEDNKAVLPVESRPAPPRGKSYSSPGSVMAGQSTSPQR